MKYDLSSLTDAARSEVFKDLEGLGIYYSIENVEIQFSDEDRETINSISRMYVSDSSILQKILRKRAIQMTVKYDLSDLGAAARLAIFKELDTNGIYFSVDGLEIAISRENEEVVDAIIQKHERTEAVLESLQRESQLQKEGLLAPSCELCGNRPAALLDLKRQVGMVVVMSTYRAEVLACEKCGDAAYKEFQKQTAIKGWTGVRSALTNPIVLGANAANYKKFKEQISRLKAGK